MNSDFKLYQSCIKLEIFNLQKSRHFSLPQAIQNLMKQYLLKIDKSHTYSNYCYSQFSYQQHLKSMFEMVCPNKALE